MASWACLYYMPYANSLTSCSADILEGLHNGFRLGSCSINKRAEVAVAVQSKARGNTHMTRHVWQDNVSKQQTQVPDSLASSSIVTFEQFLEWASNTFPSALNFTLTILGHGGRVHQVSPDEDPGYGGVDADGLQWMDIADIGPALARFNARVTDRLRLVFLQNCCKSTIEVLSFLQANGLSLYVMASQTVLGAPNTYYAPLIQSLFTQPDCSGSV
jgi:hypothetical protein